MMNERLAADGY